MAIQSFALTTVARVKSRLEIDSGTTTWDALLAELINGMSSFIEGEAGRRLVSAVYTNEAYTLDDGQTILMLRQYPVTAIASIQFRAGSVATPAWTTLTADEWEQQNSGRDDLGIIRLYMSLRGTNAIRVTYTAGYTINFTTEASHTLPYELSDLCERLVARRFKKRESEGKASEGASAGGTLAWEKEMSDDDKRILRRYIRSAFL